jgi:hypothetical protein
MPAWGDGAPVALKDEQIAAILTYIRSEWGNNADAIQVLDVVAKRKQIASRTSPWSEKELLALPSELPPASTK